MEHRAKSNDREEDSMPIALSSMPQIPNTSRHKISLLLTRTVIFLIAIQVLFFVFSPQKSQTQEVSTREISALAAQLEDVEGRLVSIDNRLVSLEREFNIVTDELYILRKEDEKPRGFLRKLLDMGRRKRKIGKLYTRSQELVNEIGKLQEERKPLVERLTILADEIIEKSSPRISLLGEIFLNTDYVSREEEEKQLAELSTLWAIVEKARKAREKYALDTIEPEDEWDFSTLLSDDPAELKLFAATLRDAAAEEKVKADQLRRRIRDLELEVEQREELLRVSEEMQRRDEERAASGVGLSHIKWDETETEREIESRKNQITELEIRAQESDEKAGRFQQQAEQIDMKLREMEDD